MSRLYIEVEVQPGSSIEGTAREMETLTSIVGVGVRAKFNGVTLLFAPGGTADNLVASYHREAAKGSDMYKIATGRGSTP